jgi:hypothetical protein
MMNTSILLTELRSKGYSIKAVGSYLDISPAENLSEELVTQLRKSKPEILCTLHQEQELRHLVRLVSDHHHFNEEDYEEALTHALADPVNALTCFTSLARRAELL